MRLLFAGTPATAVPALKALLATGHDVVAVATNPDAPIGRGRQVVASPVATEAANCGIPLLQPQRVKEPWFGDAVAQLRVDAAVIVAWGALIPDSLLNLPKHGWVNLHFSLLPAWRGAAPVQRALMAGDETTGVTTFRLVREMDAGPVWRRQSVDITADETAGELLARLASLGADTLLQTLADIQAGVSPVPQPAGVSLAPKVTVGDARIDWSAPAGVIHNLVRGTTPAPGAWTMFRGQRLKIGRTALVGSARLPDVPTDLAAGQLVATRSGLFVGTGEGRLELLLVQGVGKPPTAGADWARGARLGEDRCE